MLYPVLVRFRQLDGGAVRLYYDKNDQLLREKEYPALLNAAYDRLRINPSGVRFLYPQTVTPENLAKVKLVAAGSIRHIPAETARTFAAWVAGGGTLYLQAPGEWSDYSGGKLDLPAGFRKAVTAARSRPLWQGNGRHGSRLGGGRGPDVRAGRMERFHSEPRSRMPPAGCPGRRSAVFVDRQPEGESPESPAAGRPDTAADHRQGPLESCRCRTRRGI